MTNPTPSPEDHRRTAEELLAKAEHNDFAPMNPHRVDLISRATVHALLALGPITVTYTVPPDQLTARVAEPITPEQYAKAVAELNGAAVSTPEPPRTPPVQTTPQKRAAKKTASKETTK